MAVAAGAVATAGVAVAAVAIGAGGCRCGKNYWWLPIR
jgi:hypothetical protein